MSTHNESMVKVLKELETTSKVLVDALNAGDGEKSHEAVSILLMQGMDFFGPTSVAMQQFFPVFDAIKKQVDENNLVGALGQTEVFQIQLKEILAMILK